MPSSGEHFEQFARLPAYSTDMAEDYYKTLEVARDASPEDIQKAYRRLARKHHPDLHPDDKTAKQKFQEIQQAFDVLNDAKKRELYDRYGANFEQMGAHPGGGPGAGPFGYGGPGGYPGGGGNFEEVDLSQFFGDRFGGGGAGGGGNPFGDLFTQFTRSTGRKGRGKRTAEEAPPRGADITHQIEIPFPTSIVGGETSLQVQRPTGKVETLNVKIPAGIEDGKTIRLRGQGEPSPLGGEAGDLLLKIRVEAHPHFHRRGQNLYVKLPVSLGEAAAGAKVDVPTPRGTVSLRVPPGSSTGTKLRIKGHGVGPDRDSSGDLFAEVQVMLPAHLDDEDRELLAKLDAKHQGDIRRELRW